MARTLSSSPAMLSEKRAYARTIAGVITPRMTAYSAIVWPSSSQRERIQLKKAI